MDKFLDEQEALISRSSSPGEGIKGVPPSGKTEATGGGTTTGSTGGSGGASSNNNTIQASSAPSIPSPQPIPTQPVT